MESDDEGNDAIAMENIFEGLNGVGAMEGVNGAEAMEGVTGVAAVDVVTEVAAMEGLTRAGANQGGRKRTHCHCNSLKTAQVTLKMETVENANQGSTSVPTAVNVVDPVTLPTDQPPVATENAPTADPTDLPPRPSKKRKANASGPRRTSPAWESFTRVPESVSPEPQAACNYCDKRNEEDDSLMKMKAAEEALEEKQKVKPLFELSGKLAAETNRVRGITLLFNEPPEARKPDIKWRLYVFKTGEMLNEPLYIHRQSCYLFGRERRVADIPTDHPSCSKQHAVIQFRQVEKEQPDGMIVKQTRPYIMDLGSTNKTFVNDSPIEPQRYYELREQDTIKFGNSSREYVLLHENSASAS